MPLRPGVLLDARRCVWLEESRVLVLADIHLGHGWVERRRGSLVPLCDADAFRQRLRELFHSYAPRRLVVLGDIVHAAVPLPALEQEMRDLVDTCAASDVALTVVLGNHDRGLAAQLSRWHLALDLTDRWVEGSWLGVHGDARFPAIDAVLDPSGPPGLCLIGHEHPALRLEGAGNRSAKCPCFLTGPRLVVLPAFSPRAAGTDCRSGRFLGPIATSQAFDAAYVCLGPRLLRVPWPLPAA